MKGLIRQQISRLPFKCQASIQRAASGRKAARVEQNGTIYNQSQKSHSSAQPGVASSGSLYCCGTRETLSQPLFDDFLSVAFARVCFHRQVSPQRHLPSPPPPPLPFPPSRSRAAMRCAPKTHHRLLSESFRMDDRECFTFLRQLKARKWISVSFWNKMRLGSQRWMTARGGLSRA